MRRTVGLGLGAAMLVAIIVLGLAAVANADTTTKPYSLVITSAAGSNTFNSSTVSGASLPGGGAVPVFGGGQTVELTATFTNQTKTQMVGSANLWWPAGFSVLDSAQYPLSTGGIGTAKLASACSDAGVPAGPCVQLRSLSLVPGASMTLTMWVTTPACSAAGANQWNAEVKQANNYSGSPGNDLYQQNSFTQTYTDGACQLAFGVQPHDSTVAAPITGTAFGSTPPITVTVEDSTGAAIATSTAVVGLTTGTNPGGVEPGGDNSAAADGSTGTASFGAAPGGPTLANAGIGYTLVASSGTLLAGDSDSFNVQDQEKTCVAGSGCQINAGTGHNTVVLNPSTTGSGAGTFVESLFTNSTAQNVVCAGYGSSDPNLYESAYTATSGADRTETDTITFAPDKKLGNNVNQVLKSQQICFASTKGPFTTASGAPATYTTLYGQGVWVGILPNCTGSSPTQPCHARSQDTTVSDPSNVNGYDIVLVDILPLGWADDPYRC